MTVAAVLHSDAAEARTPAPQRQRPGHRGSATDRLGVAWRFSKPTTISVARREAVARLDEFVGPKY